MPQQGGRLVPANEGQRVLAFELRFINHKSSPKTFQLAKAQKSEDNAEEKFETG